MLTVGGGAATFAVVPTDSAAPDEGGTAPDIALPTEAAEDVDVWLAGWGRP